MIAFIALTITVVEDVAKTAYTGRREGML